MKGSSGNGFEAFLTLLGRFVPDSIRVLDRPLLHKSGLAGRVSLEAVSGLRVLSLATFGVSAIILFSWLLITSGVQPPLFYVYVGSLIIAPVSAFQLPALYLRSLARARRRQVIRDLPDFVDLLATTVEAGLALDAAIERIIGQFPGPLSEEFRRYLWEIQIGRSRTASLMGIAERTDVDDMRLIAAALAQAERHGIPIASVLRSQAEDLRNRRLQKARETALRAPIKMIFPLAFCFCPVLLILIFVPLIIRLKEQGMLTF